MSSKRLPIRLILLKLKRLFDCAGASLALALLSPLFSALAVAIKLDSQGPVFFRQKRLGYRGRMFSIFKFRTMIPNAASVGAGLPTFDGDPRVTKVGRVLRKRRLDELPQLFNVLLGQMSLVGPRPLMPDYLESYSQRDKKRMLMPPGMTGWQQVHGGATHNWLERIESDIWYVEHWTPWLDILVLLKTPAVVFKADTVYGKDGWQRCGVPDEQLAPKEVA
ncbi:MAG: sugar transferase [Armatimonadota bacterium]|nr:sugar transferase [Armatimonadota bacterium]